MDDPTEYVKYVFPADEECESEADALWAAAEHMAIMGTVIAQAGLHFGQAIMALPRTKDVAAADIVQNHLRMLTAGAAQDDPIPVTACCYLARVIAGPEVVVQQPDIETVLETLDKWSSVPRSYIELHELYGKCVALTSADVDEMSRMLRAVRDRLAAFKDE